jgi:hypothetical protein
MAAFGEGTWRMAAFGEGTWRMAAFGEGTWRMAAFGEGTWRKEVLGEGTWRMAVCGEGVILGRRFCEKRERKFSSSGSHQVLVTRIAGSGPMIPPIG